MTCLSSSENVQFRLRRDPVTQCFMWLLFMLPSFLNYISLYQVSKLVLMLLSFPSDTGCYEGIIPHHLINNDLIFVVTFVNLMHNPILQLALVK